MLFCFHALRVERPLLDIRMYANRVFAGAALSNFGLGAALFGAMILVPLYYQEVRGESVINTGLLTGPQGIGALIAMPLASRLTARFGGGRVALCGVSLLCVSTLPVHVHRRAHLDRGDLAGARRAGPQHRPVLHARDDSGLLGDASRADLRRDPADHVLQRTGGAIGTAVLAVVLQRAAGRRAHAGGAGKRVRHRLLVGAGDRRAVADPLSVVLRAERPQQAKLAHASAGVDAAAAEPMGA